MSKAQMEVQYDAAQDIKKDLDEAKQDLEANADTIPSSGTYGEGESYIAFMLSTFADASGTFGQAAGYGSLSVANGVDLISGCDEQIAEDLAAAAKEMPND